MRPEKFCISFSYSCNIMAGAVSKRRKKN
jgi:hypothetical protein